jgi:hypothetical protein
MLQSLRPMVLNQNANDMTVLLSHHKTHLLRKIQMWGAADGGDATERDGAG